LRKQAADQRPGGAAEEIRRRGDGGGAAFVTPGKEFGNPSGGRAGGKTGGKTAQPARHEQPSGALRRRKYNGAGNTDRHGRQACRPPTDLIGEAAEEQERGEIAENIGRIDQRQCDAGKSKRLPVKRIERRRQDRADKHDAELGGDRDERDAMVAGGSGIAHCHTSIRFMTIYIEYGLPR
jgi:hypothetical protein